MRLSYEKSWCICQTMSSIIQIESGDNIWLELKTKFEFTLFVVDSDDEIFMPISVWPNNPGETKLGTSSSWDEIKVTKEIRIKQDETCNNTKEYVYGGNQLCCLFLLL